MSALPWFKFYPNDWRADAALQNCSIAARGLWIECLALMHEGEPRGHLTFATGEPIDVATLARLCHLPPSMARRLIGELQRASVFSVTENRVIFSRKMIRDESRSKAAKENGRKGGNPQIGGKILRLHPVGGLTEPLTEGVKTQWPLASGLSKEGHSTSQEEALGQEGPFTSGEAA